MVQGRVGWARSVPRLSPPKACFTGMFYDNIHSEPMDFAAWPLSPKGALRVPKSASPTPSPG